MRFNIRLLVVALCVAVVATACGDDTETVTGPEIGVGTLWVTVDGSCYGDLSSVAVFVNGAFHGRTEPGGDGVVSVLPTGQYEIRVVATARPGRPTVRWNPAIVMVDRGFQTQGFSCN